MIQVDQLGMTSFSIRGFRRSIFPDLRRLCLSSRTVHVEHSTHPVLSRTYQIDELPRELSQRRVVATFLWTQRRDHHATLESSFNNETEPDPPITSREQQQHVEVAKHSLSRPRIPSHVYTNCLGKTRVENSSAVSLHG